MNKQESFHNTSCCGLAACKERLINPCQGVTGRDYSILQLSEYASTLSTHSSTSAPPPQRFNLKFVALATSGFGMSIAWHEVCREISQHGPRA